MEMVVERSPESATLSPLMRDFLTWVARRPRGYAEAMEAWRSSCPRLTIWDDALTDGLVLVERGEGAGQRGSRVVLTPRGRSLLDGG
jgi:hypothetical protein